MLLEMPKPDSDSSNRVSLLPVSSLLCGTLFEQSESGLGISSNIYWGTGIFECRNKVPPHKFCRIVLGPAQLLCAPNTCPGCSRAFIHELTHDKDFLPVIHCIVEGPVHFNVLEPLHKLVFLSPPKDLGFGIFRIAGAITLGVVGLLIMIISCSLD